MAAPIAVGPANPSWITPYYVPPNNEPPNAFAAYMSGFMQTRAPLARAEFARRLATLSPQDRSKEIADLIKARADYVSQARSAAATIEQSQPDWLKAATDLRGQNATTSVENARNATELTKSERLDYRAKQKVAEARDSLSRLTDGILRGDLDPNAAILSLKAQNLPALAGVSGDPGSAGAVGGMTSAQLSEAALQLQEEVDGLRRALEGLSDSDPQKAGGLLFVQLATDKIRSELAEPGLAKRDQRLAGGGMGWLEDAIKGKIQQDMFGGVTRTSVSGSEGGSYRGPGGGGPTAGANALSNVDAALADDPTLKFFDSQIESLQAQHGKPSAPAWAVENPTEYLRNPLLWKPPGTSERFEPAAPAAPSRPAGIGREEVLGGGASQQIMNQLRKRQARNIIVDPELPEPGSGPDPNVYTIPRRF